MGGNTINAGTDHIMGQIPIIDRPGTQSILLFFSSMGLKFLSQFSKWDNKTQNWSGWHFPKAPSHLEDDLSNFQTHLHGSALLKIDSIDIF